MDEFLNAFHTYVLKNPSPTKRTPASPAAKQAPAHAEKENNIPETANQLRAGKPAVDKAAADKAAADKAAAVNVAAPEPAKPVLAKEEAAAPPHVPAKEEAAAPPTPTVTSSSLSKLFQQLDADGSGFLDKKEIFYTLR